jgi:hypothetical protein
MEDHETRRKIIREWMALPKDKRHTEEQVVTFEESPAMPGGGGMGGMGGMDY